jgi:hypothetical protein
MVKDLVLLESTNQGGARLVHVTVRNDKNPVDVVIEFQVGDATLPGERESLLPNEDRQISRPHPKSGTQIVSAKDTISGKESGGKLLDLEADHSF